MKIRLLGTLEISTVTATARLGGPRQRAVLAALLLRSNDTASIGYLTRAAWETPPAAPESNLRTYIAGLRRMLREAGEDTARLLTRPNGYSLVVRPGELDMADFEDLAARGTQASRNSDFAAAVEHFRMALGLWRGQPLEGLELGPALQAEIAQLQERRFTVVEQYCHACLERGRHADAASELRRLICEYPLREELYGQLMSAHYHSGRQAEALEVFREARERLVRDLGIEPGPRLQRLQRETLAAPVSSRSGPSAHRQLPMDINDFTGRQDELRRLCRLVDTAATGVVIHSIEGMAGVGKTRLAIHAAHQLARAGCFEEIQLWADLRGFATEQGPADPASVLETFLRSLGVAAEQIPQDIEQRAGLYRDKLSGKRALVVLDNADGEDQVRPLLPGGPGCLVLITSRRNLGGLDGARSLVLDVFCTEEAVDLLARIAGPERVMAEPDAATRIALRCGLLPLAIALAAKRLRSRPTWMLADLADLLEADDQRMNQLNAGTRCVRAVFDMSYRALPWEQQLLFRLLGLHPGTDFTVPSAGAVADISPSQAEIRLDALLDSYLLEQATPGRYRFHDLLRDYAREQAHRESPARQDAAIGRILGWYLYTADAADRQMQPDRPRLPLDSTVAPRHELTFTSNTQAISWFEAEHANLIRATQTAADHGWLRVTWQLPWSLLSWFYLRKHWDDWVSTYRIALAAAQRLEDLTGQAVTLNGLGVAYSDLSRYSESIDCHRRALDIHRRMCDLGGQAWNLNNLGVAYSDLNRLRDAAGCFHQAVVLHKETGNRHGEGIALSNLGDTYRALDEPDKALRYLDEAIHVQRANGDQAGQRYTLCCMGDIRYAKNQCGQAIHYYRRALAASREIGDRWQVAIVLTRLALPLRDSGKTAAANTCVREACEILDQLGGTKAKMIRSQIGEHRA